MLNHDFTKYSLVLIKDDNTIFSSDKSGLRPLIECVRKYKSKFNKCTLHDKVVGLASARLIVCFDGISLVISNVISESANELLSKNKIKIETKKIVKNILNKDKSSICPMELKAQIIENNEKFFLELKDLFRMN